MASPTGSGWKTAGRWVVLCAVTACAGAVARAQSVDEGGPLQQNPDTIKKKPIGNDSVIRMVKAQLDESIIVQTIRSQPGRYDLGPEDLITLKTAGVSDTIIGAMQARDAGLAVRPVEVKGAAALTPMPDEVGVYYKDKSGDWVPLKTERVVFKSSGWLKNAATYGLVKQDMNGHLEGEKSPLVLGTGIEVLIYTPVGTDGAEYDFLRLQKKKNSREFRTLTGGLFHSESGSARNELDFTPKRIAPQMYKFTVPKDIEKGEYGVLPPGSANQRGLADTGKIYTFSIPE